MDGIQEVVPPTADRIDAGQAALSTLYNYALPLLGLSNEGQNLLVRLITNYGAGQYARGRQDEREAREEVGAA